MKKERSKLLDLIDGYEIPTEYKNVKGEPLTGKTFFSRSYSGSVKNGAMMLPRVFAPIKLLVRRLAYTSVRTYGTMLLFFGVLVTVARLIMDYIGIAEAWTYSAMATGIAVTLVGVGLMFIDKPVGAALEYFLITDYLFFEFLCIKRPQRGVDSAGGYSTPVAIIAGSLLACAGTFFHPGYALLALGVVLFSLLAFASPEFSFLLAVLLVPYVGFFDGSIFILAFLLLITSVSFARKVFEGKRVIVIEQYDILIGLMLAFVLASGIFKKGFESFESSLMIILGAVGYMIAGNLITNRRLADRLCVALCVSSVPAAIYAIVTFARGASGGDYTYTGSGFYDKVPFSVFLIVAGIFTLSALIESKTIVERIFYPLVLALLATALGFTLNFFAYTVVVFCVAAYFILKLKKLCAVAILLLYALPYALFLLPTEVLEGDFVTALLGTDVGSHFEVWRASWQLFWDNPWLGIGMGEESFLEEIRAYGVSAQSSRNLFLEIACEAGIFALVFFVLILVTAARHRGVYRRYVKHSQVRTVSKASAIALVAFVIYSTVNYVWISESLCFVFWCVLGFRSALLRIAKREHDERKLYYNNSVSSESADVDVQIDGFSAKKR